MTILLKKLKPKKQFFLGTFIALITINLIGFFPVFVNNANSQAADCTVFDPTSPKTFESRVFVDKTDQSDTNNYARGKADRRYPIAAANTNAPRTQSIKEDEQLIVYVEAQLPPGYENCYNELKQSFEFRVSVYDGPLLHIKDFPRNANFDENSKTFFAKIPISDWKWVDSDIEDPNRPYNVGTYIYFCKRAGGCNTTDTNGNDYIERFYTQVMRQPPTPATVIDPSSPLLEGGTDQNPDQVVKAEDVKLKFTNGIKDKYRLLYTETGNFTSMRFGSNGLAPVNLDWASDKTLSADVTPMTIPNKNSGIINAVFKNIIVGFNYSDAITANTTCESRGFNEICDNVVFYGTNSNGKESGEERSLPGNGFDPTLNNVAWQKGIDQNKSVGAGQPLGTVKFKAVPIIWSATGPLNWYSYVYNNNAAEFTIEVYKTVDDIKKACENDASVTDKSVCNDPTKMRFDVGKTIEVTTGTNQKTGGKGLFELVLEILTYIVIAITTVIYWIFSYILVPVLNALIRIHPFRDSFVNVIYPGWLIMRNLANIFFIIALLIMGLRVLFQFDDGGKTRSFIVRLILMALLVNFSLVIAQGVVAIADTVQSQFLPDNSKVIEALGKSIMADPAIQFQTRIQDVENGSATASLFTPIMLLITSVAGFFAFLAITAFVAIRTVALWVFYLTSPFAYFGRVLEQTKNLADKWWQEFMKYAFMVPVLAFFLNIAALMAGTLSRTNSINPEATSNLFADRAIANIEGIVLTIISQAVVLIFLFVGMQVALRSGTFGSKTIVNYAQKGFKNALTKWPGGVKDFYLDQWSKRLEESGRGKAARALTAVGKPLAFGKAIKKAQWDDPGEERRKREAKRLGNTFLTRTKSAKDDPLKDIRDKEKELNEDNKGYLADHIAKNANPAKKDDMGAAMMRLAKNGDFDGILTGAQQVTGKKYSKDAAGLAEATRDLQKKTGMSDEERLALLRTFDTQAGKKDNTKHYGGNVDYKNGKFVERKLSSRPDNHNNHGFFDGEDHNSWVKDQVKNRTAKMNLFDDISKSSIDTMIRTDAKGDAVGLTDIQAGTFLHRTPDQLNNDALVQKFRSSNNYAALRKGYEADGGLATLTQKMKDYNNVNKVLEDDAAVERQAQLIHQKLFADRGGQNTQAAGRPIGFVPNPGGNTATASAGKTTRVVQNVTQVSSPTMSSGIGQNPEQFAGQTNLGMGTVHFENQNQGTLDTQFKPRAQAGFQSKDLGGAKKADNVIGSKPSTSPRAYDPNDQSTSRLNVGKQEAAKEAGDGALNNTPTREEAPDQGLGPAPSQVSQQIKNIINNRKNKPSGTAKPDLQDAPEEDKDKNQPNA